MGLKAYKPTTSGRRGMTIVTTEELTKKKPEKSLTSFHLRSGGRNNDGRTTVRFRGAGHRRLYRKIDFRRDKVGISAKVLALEYDPPPPFAAGSPKTASPEEVQRLLKRTQPVLERRRAATQAAVSNLSESLLKL